MCFFVILSGSLFVQSGANEEEEYYISYLGKEIKDFLVIQAADQLRQEAKTVLPHNVYKAGYGECVYIDERYIVAHEEISGREFDHYVQGEECSADDESRDPSYVRTGFYDAKTLEPLFYIRSLYNAPGQVEFNKELGVFAIMYDGEPSLSYRDVQCVIIEPEKKCWRAFSFFAPRLCGYEMSWNGARIDLNLGWSPSKEAYDIMRVEADFLKSFIIIRSIDLSEDFVSDDQMLDPEEKSKEMEKRLREHGAFIPPVMKLGVGATPGSVSFLSGDGRLMQIDFDTFYCEEVMTFPVQDVVEFGVLRQKEHWVLTRTKDRKFNIHILDKEKKYHSYEFIEFGGIIGAENIVWSKKHVLDIAVTGYTKRFSVPDNKEIIGVDWQNKEIITQPESVDITSFEEYEKWCELMSASSYDLDTGQFKTKSCDWVPIGEMDCGAVINNGSQIGQAPKGWRVGVNNERYRRMGGGSSSILVRFPSGDKKCYGAEDFPCCGRANATSFGVTADFFADLYSCGKNDSHMLLVYGGFTGGQAVGFESSTLATHEVANWMDGVPLWLPDKKWLFVPRMGFYEVLEVDDSGNGNSIFFFYYSGQDYAIVMPNGLYALSSGGEGLLRSRYAKEDVDKLLRRGNNSTEVFKALKKPVVK